MKGDKDITRFWFWMMFFICSMQLFVMSDNLLQVFFGKTPEHLENVKEGSWYMTVPMMVLAGFSIVVGIYPDIFYKSIIPHMSGVLGV